MDVSTSSAQVRYFGGLGGAAATHGPRRGGGRIENLEPAAWLSPNRASESWVFGYLAIEILSGRPGWPDRFTLAEAAPGPGLVRKRQPVSGPLPGLGRDRSGVRRGGWLATGLTEFTEILRATGWPPGLFLAGAGAAKGDTAVFGVGAWVTSVTGEPESGLRAYTARSGIPRAAKAWLISGVSGRSPFGFLPEPAGLVLAAETAIQEPQVVAGRDVAGITGQGLGENRSQLLASGLPGNKKNLNYWPWRDGTRAG